MDEQNPHPNLEQLTDLAVNELTNADFSEHLRSCAACKTEFERIRQTVEMMQTDRAEEVPVYAFENLMQAFRDKLATSRETVKSSVPTFKERLQAVLSSDSFGLAPNFGFRSGQTAKSRQLLYFAGDTALDLRISQNDDEWIIEGQILGQIKSGEIKLSGNSVDLKTVVDADSNFKFPPIPAGKYAMLFVSENLEIVVPELVVEP